MSRIAQTKIVATLGPACADTKTLSRMIESGVNVARINFSHGTHESNGKLIATVRALAKKHKRHIGILQDIQGPKMRLGAIVPEGIVLTPGETVVCVTGKTIIKKTSQSLVVLPIDIPKLETYLKKGERILIADGTMEIRITRLAPKQIWATVVVGGTAFSHKGLNFPDSDIPVRSVTKKDYEDIAFGLSIGVEYLALSFVQSADDVRMVSRWIKKQIAQGSDTYKVFPKIIAKIERRSAVDSVGEILSVCDGVMVARGDLGLEVRAEEVPVIQKNIIHAAAHTGSFVIVATQMLDSMQHSPRPTRAEVSDVANAVIDHADAVMLSNETASGTYPVESVQMMRNIIIETEKSVYDDGPLRSDLSTFSPELTDSVDVITAHVRQSGGVQSPIIVLSHDAAFVRRLSLSRCGGQIYWCVPHDMFARQHVLWWGVQTVVLPLRSEQYTVAHISAAMGKIKKTGWLKKREQVVVILSEICGSGNPLYTVQHLRVT